jgi:hypothetical protein
VDLPDSDVETPVRVDNIDLLEDRAIKGWLEKQAKVSGFFSMTWKRRYVVCEGGMLYI